jgi:hypothetical protein
MSGALLDDDERIVAYIIDGPNGRRTVEAVHEPLEPRPNPFETHECGYCRDTFPAPAGTRQRFCSDDCTRAARLARTF